MNLSAEKAVCCRIPINLMEWSSGNAENAGSTIKVYRSSIVSGLQKSLWVCSTSVFLSISVSSSSCAKCLLDKYTAITMSMKRRKYCDDCGHLHLDGNFCHMFVDQNSAYDVTDDFMNEESEAADNADTGYFMMSSLTISLISSTILSLK